MFDEGGEDFIDGEDFVRILRSCQMTDEDNEYENLHATQTSRASDLQIRVAPPDYRTTVRNFLTLVRNTAKR